MKITKRLPLKNVTNFHPELKDRTEDVIERKSLVSTFTDLNEGEAIGIISSPNVDQDGDIIDPMGIKTDIYNGTCQWNHCLDSLPLGNISEWTITPEGVKGKFRFSKTYDFAIDCYNLVKEQILRGISIGYIPLTALKKGTSAFNEYAKARGWDIEGCERIITSCLWIETSLVPVGCNNDALILASKSFKSEISCKNFKIESPIEESTIVEDKIDIKMEIEIDNVEEPVEVQMLNPPLDSTINEKYLEEAGQIRSPLVTSSELVNEAVIINEPTIEVKPDVSEVIPEAIKPKVLINILRIGKMTITEDIKTKARLFLAGKSF